MFINDPRTEIIHKQKLLSPNASSRVHRTCKTMRYSKTKIQAERWANIVNALLDAPIQDFEAERVRTFYSKVHLSFTEKLAAAKILRYA